MSLVSRCGRQGRSGFTLVHLLVIVLILAFLVAITLPSLCASSAVAERIACAANLRQLGVALQRYRDENGGELPRTIFDGAEHPVPVFFTNPQAPNPFSADGPRPNDVTAALFLAVRTPPASPQLLGCHSSTQERSTQDARITSNVPGPQNLSYSYQNPYAPAGVKHTHRADFAWLADINPGGHALLTTPSNAPRAAMRQVNSPNHAGDGQNVFYADGHAEWHKSPFVGRRRAAAAGPQGDNIYTAGGPGTGVPVVVVAAPVDADDNVLLPVAASGPASSAMSVRRVAGVREIVWLGAAVAVGVGVLALTLIVCVRRRRMRPAMPR